MALSGLGSALNKGFQFLIWCRHTSPPHEVSGAQCLSRRLILAVFELVFVFRLGGPTPSEAAGGRPQTEGSKTLGPSPVENNHAVLCWRPRPRGKVR